MLPIRFRYIELLSKNYDFKKKVKKILTSNISEIYGSILLPKELYDWYKKSTATKNFKGIKPILH